MSAIIDATYEGETFEVEIFHDGHIEFPGRNLQHEQAMAEFTDSESAVTKLYDLWKESPTKVIFENLELPENSAVLLAADCAEHVLYLFETARRGDNRPRRAIIATRDFVAGKISTPELETAVAATLAAARSTRTVWAAAASGLAAVAAAAGAAKAARTSIVKRAVRTARAEAAEAAAAARAAAARKSMVKRAARAARAEAVAARALAWAEKAEEAVAWAAVALVMDAAERAGAAAAYSAALDTDSSKWHRAFDIERAWQIRRFVDAMEAIGQGFDWPDMKVTP
jgi:hypothetical protein